MIDRGSNSLLAIGVGHAGCEVLRTVDANRMDQRFDRLGIDTDATELERVAASGIATYLAGGEACQGKGVRSDVEQAIQCMEDATADFAGMLKGHSLVVVVAGLGGCTGGALEPLLRTAEETQTPVILLGILPFAFESIERKQRANALLNDVEMYCQAVILAPNDLALRDVGKLPAEQAFAMVNQYLGEVLLGVMTPYSARPLLNMDTGILGTLGRNGTSRCQFVHAFGDDAEHLLGALRGQPLFQRQDILRSADCAVALLRLNGDCSGDDLDFVMEGIGRILPNMNLETSACVDSEMSSSMSLTLLLHQMDVQPLHAGTPPAQKRTPPVLSKEMLGVFSGDAENIWNGENLDIPTFRRRGVNLDRGK